MPGFRRLARCSRATMALTLSQLFMGSITIGIATFRGTEANLSFHVESLVGHANYAASTLASGHARAADAIADDNVISSAVMGPRFAVEADNITMDVNAMIACPQTHDAHMRKICAEYHANKWRALAKLAWVRAEQAMLWGSLGQLSSDIDRVMSQSSLEQSQSTIHGLDARVSLRIEDPAMQGDIWGTDDTGEACALSEQDALGSPMPGAAFPVLMENLVGDLPKALVQLLPRVICGAESAIAGSAGGGGGPVLLPQVPSVAEQTAQDCTRLEQEMQCQMGGDACGMLTQPAVVSGRSGAPTFSSDVAPYISCAALGPRSASPGGPGYAYRDGSGQIVTCSFDAARCQNERLAANSAAYLQSIGLSQVASGSSGRASLGGATHAPSDGDWNHADRFRACAYASKPVNGTVSGIANAVRTLVSFGTATSSSTLQDRYDYEACAKWYFPDGGESPYAAVPHDQQPFVAAWTFALVAPRR